jgi:hypothetical protein
MAIVSGPFRSTSEIHWREKQQTLRAIEVTLADNFESTGCNVWAKRRAS